MNKILQSIQNFGKNFEKLSNVGKMVIIGILLFTGYSTIKMDSNSKLNKFILEYEELQKNAIVTTKLADSLKKQVIDLTDESGEKEQVIRRLKITISARESQKNKLQDTQRVLEQQIYAARIDSNVPKLIAYQDIAITNLKTQVALSDSIISDKESIITEKNNQTVLLQKSVALSMQRGDSLQAILSTLPPTPKNPDKFFGFIPKPSRKMVGVVSFGAGILAGVQLAK